MEAKRVLFEIELCELEERHEFSFCSMLSLFTNNAHTSSGNSTINDEGCPPNPDIVC